jgi:hypothetical protein
VTDENPGSGDAHPHLTPEQLEEASVWGDLDAAPYAWLEEEEERALAAALAHQRGAGVRGAFTAAVTAAAALWTFLMALALMKDGARALAPALGAAVDGALNALGLGWLGALVVLSGSPVAASALALLEGGSLSPSEAYAMLVGSRLGAAFVVLVVGTVYALRADADRRRTPISVGVLALAMTAIVYIPGGIAGGLVLESGVLDGLTLTPPAVIFDLIDGVTAPVLQAIESIVPPDNPIGGAVLFGLGLGCLLVSFGLVDRLLPSLESARGDERARWYVGPWTMFGIGLVVALATLSVAVALSLLVPLVAKGYVRREQTLPYIAGANITTLADTLVVAILLDSDVAPRLVLALVIGITTWTLLLLVFAGQPVRRIVFGFQGIVLRSPARLAAFVAVLVVIPILLLAFG